MTWMQVPGDKLLEPVVNLVIKHFFLTNCSNLTRSSCISVLVLKRATTGRFILHGCTMQRVP